MKFASFLVTVLVSVIIGVAAPVGEWRPDVAHASPAARVGMADLFRIPTVDSTVRRNLRFKDEPWDDDTCLGRYEEWPERRTCVIVFNHTQWLLDPTVAEITTSGLNGGAEYPEAIFPGAIGGLIGFSNLAGKGVYGHIVYKAGPAPGTGGNFSGTIIFDFSNPWSTRNVYLLETQNLCVRRFGGPTNVARVKLHVYEESNCPG